MKHRPPKDCTDVDDRRKTDGESAKLCRTEILKWVDGCKTANTEQVPKHRSLFTSLHRRSSRTSDSMPPKIPDGTKSSINSLSSETTRVGQATPPTNADNAPPAIPVAALEEIEPTFPNETVQTLPINIPQNSTLLDLPTEIRLRIYDYLLKPELPVCLLVSTNIYVWGQGLPKDIGSCARVCKDLNREIQDISWERLHFKIRPDNGRGLPSSSLVGKAENCQLLSKIRYAEICFPITAIHNYDNEDRRAAVVRRMKLCCDMLERNTVLRTLSFNCDTTAFIGEHDDQGVELFAKTFCDLLTKKRSSGVNIKLMGVSKRSGSAICLKVFREGGLID